MSDKVKVIGYAQRVLFDDGIEYRNFSDDLVGNQQTEDSDGDSSVFTFGNFVTTTNYDGKSSRIYSTKKFSNFYTLNNYNLSSSQSKALLNNNVNVSLNLDNTDLCNFAYFGSATEFVRVSIEKIITNWPASLYLNPLNESGVNTVVGDTIANYTYDSVLNKASFSVDINFINNKFGINILTGGTIANTFNQTNTLRDLVLSYLDYSVLVNENEYRILSFTGATNITNDFIYLEVEGDPFGYNGSASAIPTYHIKPSKVNEEAFFNSLNEYEDNLLSRLTTPKYTSKYSFKREDEAGKIINGNEELTWPVTDGYNIDYDTPDYLRFVSSLLEITKGKDGIESDLMTRFLTSEAISDFDTVPNCDGTQEETAGQKMNKTLKIYGREFDEIKKYIDGISFANVVTYDKKENTPDQLVKYLARVLGWELTSSIVENDLVKSYLNVGARSYDGYSRGLSPVEAEVELWRRLILNSSWIWKSKGTRKTIEFFFKLIGTPDGLVEFDEHVYVAKEPIDMNIFYATLEANGLPKDLSKYNVDYDGYPKFFQDTSRMYFQKGGQWYRQTAGSGATQYELTGNNPHVGPYDSGKEYINQLENIIPAFTAFTLTSTTVTTGTTQLFTNYNNGIVNQYTGATYVTLQNDDNVILTGKIAHAESIIEDPCPQIELTDCGCDVPEDDEALKIDIIKIDPTELQIGAACAADIKNSADNVEGGYIDVTYNLYDPNGILSSNSKTSKYVSEACCTSPSVLNGTPYYYEEYYKEGTSTVTKPWKLLNCGYLCTIPTLNGVGCTLSCQWLLNGSSIGDMEAIGADYFLKFIDPKGDIRVVNEADSCFCPAPETTGVSITDPYTGTVGWGCKLEQPGIDILVANPTDTNRLYQIFKQRAIDGIGCKSTIIAATIPVSLPII